jgi:two-component system CheB/CheR fusion protein
LLSAKNLPDSESMYRSLFQNSSEAMLIIKNKKYVACNKVALKILGLLSAKNITSISPSDISPPTQPCGRASANKADEMMAIAYQNGEHRFEWLHQNSANEFFRVEVLLTVIHYNNEELLHVVWRDISVQATKDKCLMVAELVYQKTTDAVMVTDNKNIIIDVNPAFTNITGYSKKEAIGNFAGFMKSGTHDNSFYQKMWESINQEGAWKGQIWDKQKS